MLAIYWVSIKGSLSRQLAGQPIEWIASGAVAPNLKSPSDSPIIGWHGFLLKFALIHYCIYSIHILLLRIFLLPPSALQHLEMLVVNYSYIKNI
jgi:hypothetical protein